MTKKNSFLEPRDAKYLSGQKGQEQKKQKRRNTTKTQKHE